MALLAVLSLSIVTPAVADEARTLFDFAKPDAAQAWQPVNDGVMGGVSDGRFRITDRGTMEFLGTLSLENNGGFASVTVPEPLGPRNCGQSAATKPAPTQVPRARARTKQQPSSTFMHESLIGATLREREE